MAFGRDQQTCAAAGGKLHAMEVQLAAGVRKNPKLQGKLTSVRRQLQTVRAKCLADARRRRQVTDAQARAERQGHVARGQQARHEGQRSKLQVQREAFELKQQQWQHRQERRQAGEFVPPPTPVVLGGLALAGAAVGAFFLLR